jgi:hypothetical protein
VNFYQGEIDGDMEKTHASLVVFSEGLQQPYAGRLHHSGVGQFRLPDIEAIRSRYRLISAG